MSDILEEFEKRIAENKRDIEEQEHALAVLKRTMRKPLLSKPEIISGNEQIKDINFDDLIGSIDKTKRRTLIDEVRDIVSHFGDNEFTVAHIEAALKKTGTKIDAKNPRARIGIALSTVVEEGLIVRTGVGGGNIPHRYKLKSAMDGGTLI